MKKKKQHIAADMLKLHKDNPYPAKDPTPEEIKAHFETFKKICDKATEQKKMKNQIDTDRELKNLSLFGFIFFGLLYIASLVIAYL